MKNSETVAKHRKFQKKMGFKRKEIEVTIEDGLLTPRNRDGKYAIMGKKRFLELVQFISDNYSPEYAGIIYKELYTYLKKYLGKSIVMIEERRENEKLL